MSDPSPQLAIPYIAPLDLEELVSVEIPFQGLVLPVARPAVDLDGPRVERLDLEVLLAAALAQVV